MSRHALLRKYFELKILVAEAEQLFSCLDGLTYIVDNTPGTRMGQGFHNRMLAITAEKHLKISFRKTKRQNNKYFFTYSVKYEDP